MTSLIDRLKIFFLGFFFIACIAVWCYQLLWVAPEKACEGAGNWWDSQSRVCAKPIFLPNLTGRPVGQLSAAALKARADAAKTDEAKTLGLSPASSAPAKPAP